jgi:predicted component of type VI protein secretion system
MIDGSWLVMSQGPQPGQTFMLDRDWITVGRDPSNDIVISDPQVSRQHARITHQGHALIIEDVGSTNGTFANGVRLTGSHVLSNGDVIGLGDGVTLTYYEVGVAADVAETVVGRPGSGTAPSAAADSSRERAGVPPAAAVATPPPPTAMPAARPVAPAPPPVQRVPPAYPVYPTPLPGEASVEGGKKGRPTWLFIGCGLLVVLAILSCAAVVALDALGMLPDFFYEPIRWLGLEPYVTGW